jgi:hypothetical protein
MTTVQWIQMGERQYAVLSGTDRPFARVYPKEGRWVVQFRYGPRRGCDTPVRGVGLMKRMVTRWAEANVERLRGMVPPKARPFDPPGRLERYFYDAIWPGYVPASRVGRMIRVPAWRADRLV